MSQVCPDCGSSGTTHFIAQVGHKVCSHCGTVSDDIHLYEPSDVHDVAYSLGAPQQYRASSSLPLAPIRLSRRPLWTNDREQQRRISELRYKPEVDARIRATIGHLGYPGLFDQVDFLFRRARDESWREHLADHDRTPRSSNAGLPSPSLAAHSTPIPPRVKWGISSLLLATACCYVVLRRQGVHIDLGSVSSAAKLPYPKVRLAFKRLRLLVKAAVQNIRLADPDAFVHRVVAFFYFHTLHKSSSTFSASVLTFLRPFQAACPDADTLFRHDPARIFYNTPFEAVEATALDLCAFWWPNRDGSRSIPAHIAAFAIVILAFEAHRKTLAPTLDIFCYTHPALEFDPNLLSSAFSNISNANSDAMFSRNATACYKELCEALRLQAAKIPWLADVAPVSKKRRSRLRSNPHKRAAMSDLARLDVIIHTLDVLDLWRSVSSKPSDAQQPLSTPSISSKVAPVLPSTDSEQDEACSDSSDGAFSDHVIEMNNDEFECFLSEPAASATRTDMDEATEDANDEQVWPRMQQKLEAAGALNRATASDVSKPVVHPIDLLTDDQVDQLLFDANELASLFRTDPVERSIIERAKVAAGDWPAQSDQERNAEFAAIARSLHQKSPSRGELESQRNKSTEHANSTRPAGLNRGKTRKQADSRKKPSAEAESESKTSWHSSSTSRARKRIKNVIVSVSLREQEQESDWSDGALEEECR